MQSRASLSLGTVLLIALGSGCTRQPLVFPRAPVVLISIDTLRSDHLPAYGYRGVSTPHLDRLATDAITFETAWSPTPMTLPSHVTMLTGLLPPGHGVRNNVGFGFDGRAHPSLPRLLTAAGYTTGAAVSSFVLRGETGLRGEFGSYDDAVDQRVTGDFTDQQRSGDATLAAAAPFFSSHKARPFFYLFHIYEPHVPYAPPEPWKSRYRADPYDGEIAAADAIVGKLLDELRRLDLYDKSLIIVTSDHGEGLGDHGEDQHSILLYREALQVPLLVKLPGRVRAGTRERRLAQLTDLVPTVLEAVGQPVPGGLSGRSLLAAASPGMAYGETLYPRLQLGWSDLRSMTDGRWHLIDGPRPELYDLAADPRETRDRAVQEPARLAALRAELAKVPRGSVVPASVDAETAERVAALGYVGSVRSTPSAANLPNPRDMLGTLEPLREAYQLAADGRLAHAADLLKDLVARQPGLLEAWIKLGDVLVEDGRARDAVTAYARALEASAAPLPDVLAARGTARLRAGDLGGAAQDASAARAAVPIRAGLLLADVQIQRGDHAAASRVLDEIDAEAKARGQGSPRGVAARRADILARSGRVAEAEASYHAALAAYPDDLTAAGNLAALLYASGRREEVDALFDAVHAQNPGPRAARLAAAAYKAFGEAAKAEAWRRRAER